MVIELCSCQPGSHDSLNWLSSELPKQLHAGPHNTRKPDGAHMLLYADREACCTARRSVQHSKHRLVINCCTQRVPENSDSRHQPYTHCPAS